MKRSPSIDVREFSHISLDCDPVAVAEIMDVGAFNRSFSQAPIVMSVMALATAAVGAATGLPASLSGESSTERLFQVLIFGQVPLILGFLATAPWRRPLRNIGLLLLQALVAGAAIVAPRYIEDGRIF